MALLINDKFAPRANPGDANYPNGSIKNESAPGAKDGTPLDADWGNDYAGFDAALFAETGITPSGDPDTALSSQRLTALKKITNSNSITLDYAKNDESAQINDEVTISDRGYARFKYVDSSSVVDNGYDIISYNGVKQLSIKLIIGWVLSAKAFGLIGDDIAIETGGMQLFFDSAASVLDFGDLQVIYDDQLELPSYKTLKGIKGKAQLKYAGLVTGKVATINCQRKSNIEIYGIKGRAIASDDLSATFNCPSWITFDGSTDIEIHGCDIELPNVTPSANSPSNIRLREDEQDGTASFACERIHIHNNKLVAPRLAILSQSGNSQTTESIHIHNNDIYANTADGLADLIKIDLLSNNVHVHNNFVYGFFGAVTGAAHACIIAEENCENINIHHNTCIGGKVGASVSGGQSSGYMRYVNVQGNILKNQSESSLLLGSLVGEAITFLANICEGAPVGFDGDAAGDDETPVLIASNIFRNITSLGLAVRGGQSVKLNEFYSCAAGMRVRDGTGGVTQSNTFKDTTGRDIVFDGTTDHNSIGNTFDWPTSKADVVALLGVNSEIVIASHVYSGIATIGCVNTLSGQTGVLLNNTARKGSALRTGNSSGFDISGEIVRT